MPFVTVTPKPPSLSAAPLVLLGDAIWEVTPAAQGVPCGAVGVLLGLFPPGLCFRTLCAKGTLGDHFILPRAWGLWK